MALATLWTEADIVRERMIELMATETTLIKASIIDVLAGENSLMRIVEDLRDDG